MEHRTLLLISLCLSLPVSVTGTTVAPAARLGPAQQPTPTETKAIAWAKLDLEAALLEAAKQKTVVFVDLWTKTCGWCRKLEAVTFKDTGVIDALKPMVCLSIDAESALGAPIARRFGVGGYPTLLFLEPDGAERDRIGGFLEAAPFRMEVLRIARNENTYGAVKRAVELKPKDVVARLDLAILLQNRRDVAGSARERGLALQSIAQNEGFDASSIDARWTIAQRLRSLADHVGAEAQMREIKKLDPEGKSKLMRRLALNALVEGLNRSVGQGAALDSAPLRVFLAVETFDDLLFDGWQMVRDVESFAAGEALKKGDAEAAKRLRVAWIGAAQAAWKHCPVSRRTVWAQACAAKLRELGDALPAEGRELLAELSR